MKKIKNCTFTVLLLFILSSCTLLKIIDNAWTIDTRNNDKDYLGNIKIYVENKTNETIVIYNKDYLAGIELARISTGKVQLINIRNGITIYISGGSTKKQYREILCDKDNETFVIY